MDVDLFLIEMAGMRHFTIEAALMKVSDSFFLRSPVAAQVVLSGISDASEVLTRLLVGGHSVIAGRPAGVFRQIDRTGIADDILRSMKAADYDVREIDPFAQEPIFGNVS